MQKAMRIRRWPPAKKMGQGTYQVTNTSSSEQQNKQKNGSNSNEQEKEGDKPPKY